MEYDLRSIVIDDVSVGDHHLVANPPIILSAEILEGSEMVVFSHLVIRMFVHGETHEERRKEVEEEIVWLWENYAMADDGDLSGDAKTLKRAMLEMFEEGT